MSDIYFSSSSITTIWWDKLGATYLSANLISYACTKHVDVDYHFVQDRVAEKEIQIRFITSKNQLVDVLTKPLTSLRLCLFMVQASCRQLTFSLRGCIMEHVIL